VRRLLEAVGDLQQLRLAKRRTEEFDPSRHPDWRALRRRGKPCRNRNGRKSRECGQDAIALRLPLDPKICVLLLNCRRFFRSFREVFPPRQYLADGGNLGMAVVTVYPRHSKECEKSNEKKAGQFILPNRF
jgi:hypothetical protein